MLQVRIIYKKEEYPLINGEVEFRQETVDLGLHGFSCLPPLEAAIKLKGITYKVVACSFIQIEDSFDMSANGTFQPVLEVERKDG